MLGKVIVKVFGEVFAEVLAKMFVELSHRLELDRLIGMDHREAIFFHHTCIYIHIYEYIHILIFIYIYSLYINFEYLDAHYCEHFLRTPSRTPSRTPYGDDARQLT